MDGHRRRRPACAPSSRVETPQWGVSAPPGRLGPMGAAAPDQAETPQWGVSTSPGRLVAAGRLYGMCCMDPVDELLSGDDTRASAALARLTPDDWPRLQAALSSGEAGIRWWAVCGLAQFSGPEIVNALLACAADPDADVRAAALHALGAQRAAEAVTPLLFALADPSPFLARLAADALIHIGAPAVPGLLRALENDAQPGVRLQAARALALIGDSAAIPALFRALEDESVLVQYWAEQGLERLGAGQVYFMP